MGVATDSLPELVPAIDSEWVAVRGHWEGDEVIVERVTRRNIQVKMLRSRGRKSTSNKRSTLRFAEFLPYFEPNHVGAENWVPFALVLPSTNEEEHDVLTTEPDP